MLHIMQAAAAPLVMKRFTRVLAVITKSKANQAVTAQTAMHACGHPASICSV